MLDDYIAPFSGHRSRKWWSTHGFRGAFFPMLDKNRFFRQGDRLNMGANVSTSHERFSSVFFWVNETIQFRMKQHLNSMQMRVTTPAAHWPGQQRDILTLKPTCRSYWGVSWFLNDIQWHLWFVMALNSIWWNWWSNIIKASELLKPIKNDVSKPLEKLCIVMYLKNPIRNDALHRVLLSFSKL